MNLHIRYFSYVKKIKCIKIDSNIKDQDYGKTISISAYNNISIHNYIGRSANYLK